MNLPTTDLALASQKGNLSVAKCLEMGVVTTLESVTTLKKVCCYYPKPLSMGVVTTVTTLASCVCMCAGA